MYIKLFWDDRFAVGITDRNPIEIKLQKCLSLILLSPRCCFLIAYLVIISISIIAVKSELPFHAACYQCFIGSGVWSLSRSSLYQFEPRFIEPDANVGKLDAAQEPFCAQSQQFSAADALLRNVV